jgi:hypothetical protein
LRFPESLEKSLSAIELTNLVDDPYAAFMVYYSAFMRVWVVGDLEGMLQHTTAALTVAEKLRDRYRLGIALWFHECVNLAEGDWKAARDFSERSLTAAGSPGVYPMQPGKVGVRGR